MARPRARFQRVVKELHALAVIPAIVILGTETSYPQPQLPAEIDTLLHHAIVATVNQQYERALANIEQVVTRAPAEPIGHLFRAATLQSRMLDYEDDRDEKDFMKSLKECRRLAGRKLRRQPNDAQAHFVMGSAYGYESFHLGKKRRYLEALHTGWKTIQHLETALRLDPELFDAYLGIGTYKYYRSKLKLFFLADERAEGLAMVRQAATHGRYARYAAINGLTWILLDEDRPAEAFALADSILQTYPDSRFFLWGAAEAAARNGNHEQARELFRTLMLSLQQEGRLSPYLEAVCRIKIARLDFRDGRTETGCQELQHLARLDWGQDKRRREVQKQIASLEASCSGADNGASNRLGADGAP